MPEVITKSQTAVFHPAVQRALNLAAQTHPDVVRRAQVYLTNFLQWTKDCPNAWNSSTLARTDFPVEFSFVSFDKTLRYTVEVADPSSDTSQRLDQVVDLIRNHTNFRPDPLILNRLRELQQSAKLKYGAWLGGKHNKTTDRFKIYVEVPKTQADSAARWLKSYIGEPAMVPAENNEVVMVGYDLASGNIEFYHHVTNLNTVGLRIILRWLDLENRMDELIKALTSVYFYSISQRLPGPISGYSIAISPDNEIDAFTYYSFANSLFGSDFHIRQKIHDFAALQGWDLGWYTPLSAPLTETCNSITAHGMFGFAFTKQSPILASFGLTPPVIY